MNNYNITNIKDLPQLEQILDGNFLVVENTTGTNKLDFSDFVVGPNNTSFYNTIANDIVSLSGNAATTNSSLTSLSSSTLSALSSFNTRIQEISSNLNQVSFYYYTGNVFKNLNQNLAFTNFVYPSNLILLNSDIKVAHSSEYFLSASAFFHTLSTLTANNNGTSTVKLVVSSSNYAAELNFDYTVFATSNVYVPV